MIPSNNDVTIAIVKHNKLPEEYFLQSLYCALNQIVVKPAINIYTDRTNINKNLDSFLKSASCAIRTINIPSRISGMHSAIREFIIRNTCSEYLAFWDSDDIYTNDRLWQQMTAIKAKSLELCFADFYIFDSKKVHSKTFFQKIGLNKRKINLLCENYAGLGITTARTDFLKKLAPFPQSDKNFPLDWWLILKAKLSGVKIGYVNNPLGYYRIYPDSKSALFLYDEKSVKITDITLKKFFSDEKETKILLYRAISDIYPEAKKLFEHYREIDIDKNFHSLKEKFMAKKYKNPWGGLIQSTL